MNAQGTDRAHLIPSGSLINAELGPIKDFTILRFGLGLEEDDAPSLWASKVNRLLGYWLPTAIHSGKDSANAFADSLQGYEVIGAALDYESVGGIAPPQPYQVEDFRVQFKVRRPDLKLGFYGTRYTVPAFPLFDWGWIAADPKQVPWDMHQTVSKGVDCDEWHQDLDSFIEFFGGDMALTSQECVALAFTFGQKKASKSPPEPLPTTYTGSDGEDHLDTVILGYNDKLAEIAARATGGNGPTAEAIADLLAARLAG